MLLTLLPAIVLAIWLFCISLMFSWLWWVSVTDASSEWSVGNTWSIIVWGHISLWWCLADNDHLPVSHSPATAVSIEKHDDFLIETHENCRNHAILHASRSLDQKKDCYFDRGTLFKLKIPLRVISKRDLMCLGRESNPYGHCCPRDFPATLAFTQAGFIFNVKPL